MKAILTTDTHLGHKKFDKTWLDITKTFFQDLVSFSEQHDIKTLWHLGDFFDNRKILSLLGLEYTMEIGKLLNNSFDEVKIVVGNHDTYYKTELFPTPLQILNLMENIYMVHTETEVDENVFMIPWGSQLPDRKGAVLMGHLEMNGPILNRSQGIAKGHALNIEDFSIYDKVYSGHFHTPGQYKNIQYIGAPYHMTFNDSGPRGFYIWDDGNLEFQEYTKAPKFVILKAGEEIEESQVDGNIVRLIFEENLGSVAIENIINRIYDMGPMKMDVEFTFRQDIINEEVSEEILDNSGNIDIIQEYLEKMEIPEYLNKKVLVSLIDKMYKDK